MTIPAGLRVADADDSDIFALCDNVSILASDFTGAGPYVATKTLRAIRRDAVEKFKKQQKAAELTEDDLKSLESDIQKLTDSKSTEIDETMKSKEKEIMEI